MVKCDKCNYIYDPEQSFATLPSNFSIAGVSPDAKIPQCPHCEEVDFMGIAEQQIAADPRFKSKT